MLALMFKDEKGTISKLKYLDGTDANIYYTVSGLAGNTSSLTDQKLTASGNFTTASVPEPTSAMLLLLGVAGMALRRRRA